jgi:hypothetical protein
MTPNHIWLQHGRIGNFMEIIWLILSERTSPNFSVFHIIKFGYSMMILPFIFRSRNKLHLLIYLLSHSHKPVKVNITNYKEQICLYYLCHSNWYMQVDVIWISICMYIQLNKTALTEAVLNKTEMPSWCIESTDHFKMTTRGYKSY